MTPQQNYNIDPRADASDAEFAFFYGPSATRFYPGAGARLSFASRGVDTLTLPGLPAGLVGAGGTVTVTRFGTTVFKGTVDKVVRTWPGGGETYCTATVVGPWSLMLRKVFRQAWTVSDRDGGTTTESTAHCILNQAVDGEPKHMRDTAAEILGAGSGCGYAFDELSCLALPETFLPFDEVRNITVADALNRLLRFHPRYVVRFDYAAATPKIMISNGDAEATGIEDDNVLVRERNTIAHPIVGVDIATEDIDTASVVDPDTGAVKPMRAVTHQTAGNTSSIDCLHVFMPLQPASATTSWESLEVEAESIPDGTNPTALRNWWISKHPRLKDITAAQITTISQQRSGTQNFGQITSCTEDALTAFGLDAETVRFTATVTITKADDIEEKLVLTMDFVTTDAHAGKHTRQTGSSALAAETLPEGLAAAILAQRGGALESEDVTIRLGDEFPVVGSECDGLVLQNFDVDLDDCTATLHFGHPDYLTPEDMRDLLNGFRARGFASNSPNRGTGEVAEDAPEAVGGVQPLNTTEFQPGTKKKTVVKDANDANAGKILLDSTAVGSYNTMEVKNLTVGSGSSAQTVKVLATSDITVTGGGSGEFDHQFKLKNFGGNNYVGIWFSGGNYKLMVNGQYVDVENNHGLTAIQGENNYRRMSTLGGATINSVDVYLNISKGTNGYSASYAASSDASAKWSILIGTVYKSGTVYQYVVGAIVLNSSISADDTEVTEQDVVTHVDYSTSSHKLTQTKKTVTVLAARDPSAPTTDVFEATAHSNEHSS